LRAPHGRGGKKNQKKRLGGRWGGGYGGKKTKNGGGSGGGGEKTTRGGGGGWGGGKRGPRTLGGLTGFVHNWGVAWLFTFLFTKLHRGIKRTGGCWKQNKKTGGGAGGGGGGKAANHWDFFSGGHKVAFPTSIRGPPHLGLYFNQTMFFPPGTGPRGGGGGCPVNP